MDSSENKSQIPLARIRKIVKADRDIATCTKESLIMLSLAAEGFIQRVMEAAGQLAVRDHRVTVSYQDLALTVRKNAELLFLQEIMITMEKEAALRKGDKAKNADDIQEEDEEERDKNRSKTGQRSIFDAFKGKGRASGFDVEDNEEEGNIGGQEVDTDGEDDYNELPPQSSAATDDEGPDDDQDDIDEDEELGDAPEPLGFATTDDEAMDEW